ncbi:MAG: MurR/RpiR family transcriptional regulator [Curvibacter sp.]|nr:MurR/RpiR family transcriptional regulator [Curvibacter sp.]
MLKRQHSDDWASRFAGVPVLQLVARRAPELPAALQRMARAVLAHPFRAATLGIEEFAREVSVSVATANRLARSLGFAGYPQFRAELASGFEAILAPVESLRHKLEQPASTLQTMCASLHETRSNLERTQQALQAQPCEAAVHLLGAAQQVLTLGWGSSAYLAGLLQHELEPYCPQVYCLAQAGGPSHAARQLFKRGPSDVLVAMAFPRYVSDTVELARLARQRGMKVLALTDKPSSPLVELADVTLYAHTDCQVAATSNASALALLEALVAAMARASSGAVEQGRELARSVMPWLHLETPAVPRPRAPRRPAGAPSPAAQAASHPLSTR